ncbi:MAG: tryptophan 7-halogenase [Sphingomonas sp.]|uniref:tryptophan halogenase family protein n=1 Tax=Sphingomonas sp. TaxID=28214 RepID=UPI001AFF0F87|nr:tryptophan halogenase family protein [Sphingomonas sp.]MBO9624387.1 tryptophan 7-halogenase [Sphingomonas sp.]
MQDLKIRNIVIVGGGTSGWMAAAAMSKLLHDDEIRIRVIESDAIGTVGVGEATIPHILYFNRLLGLDEDDFVRKTSATFKLGIEFVNWGRIGDRYIHPFGTYGQEMEGLHFHHFWLRHAKAATARPLDDYCLATLAARAGKFQRPDPTKVNSPLSAITYAFQFDAALYARYLRQFAEAHRVVRTEGKVISVQQHGESGFVESVTLESGEIVPGDLFIDCSGFRGLLIEQTLKSGFDDWSAWLPNDRAVARASTRIADPVPFTRATAKSSGWQWHIPLQSRTGNGHVYCSEHISDEQALESLNADILGEPISEPNFLRFKAGIRRKPWNKNVVSLGLASGFLEPLESTSIHLGQSAIARLMTNFPDKKFNQHDIDYYNRRTRLEWEQIRDFIVLHYKATERDDSPYWNYCRTMDIPQTLADRIAIFKENARLYRHDNELFTEPSWLAVLHGQRVAPQRHHPIADILPDAELEDRMERIAAVMRTCAARMPSHQEFIDRHCRSQA